MARIEPAASPPIGVFERADADGRTRQRRAYTAADVVKLKFDGWREVQPTVTAAASAAADRQPAAKPTQAAKAAPTKAGDS